MPAYLCEFLDIVELLHFRSESIEDGHVVCLGEEGVLQVLEDRDGIAEQHLQQEEEEEEVN